MRFQVITDQDDYCVLVRHTGTKLDFIDLNLEDYDFSNERLRAYKLEGNKLMFDESRYAQIQKNNQEKSEKIEMLDLEQKLKETDYIISKWGEEIIELSNPLTWISDVIKISIKFIKEYKDTLERRKTWRKRIEEIRNKY